MSKKGDLEKAEPLLREAGARASLIKLDTDMTERLYLD
jgi:hypothetical protein